MGSAPSPPPAPDPVATASAQTGENVDTAIANATLSHVNQTDPSGSTSTYSTTGTSTFTDPVSGKTYNIPNYAQKTNLSPAAQQIFNTNQATQGNIADTANIQSQQIGNSLNNPINLKGVNLSSVGQLPNADLSANNINKFINTNWEQPLAYSQGNQQEQLNQNLADQGINLNDPAYNQAQINEGQNFQQQQDTYANSMYSTAGSNILGATALADQNQLATQQANNQAALGQQGFNNQAMLTNQNQPINAITALMSGSQVQQPNFMNTPQTTIPTTDYANIVNQSYQDQLAAYNAQVQAQSSSMGGLFGLGGSVLGGLVGL
jgi:hypothetical protein